MKVYLAGAIAGLMYGEAVDWREYAQRKLALANIDAYSPMRAKKFLKDRVLGGADDKHPLTSARGIVTRDRFDVMNADLVLANLLDTDKVSIGTMFEMAWADMLRVPIVVVMEDGNLHQHLFLHETAGFIVPTLDEGIEIVIAILNQ